MIFGEQASSIPSTTGTQPAHLTAGVALESARLRPPATAAAPATTSPTLARAELARVIVVAVDSSGSAARYSSGRRPAGWIAKRTIGQADG